MRFDNTEKIISKYFDEKLLSNVAVKIGKASEVYSEIYRSENGEINENTIFDMASVTKVMSTTLLALIAIDEGLFSYNTFVRDIFTETPEHFKDLKISHLLTHTIGIGYRNLCELQNNYENIHNYILNLKGNPIGIDVEYSCPAFILLGKIIENIYKKRLDLLFDKKLQNH